MGFNRQAATDAGEFIIATAIPIPSPGVLVPSRKGDDESHEG